MNTLNSLRQSAPALLTVIGALTLTAGSLALNKIAKDPTGQNGFNVLSEMSGTSGLLKRAAEESQRPASAERMMDMAEIGGL